MEEQLTGLFATAVPRRFWGRAPQSPPPARPYAVLSRISGARDYHAQGPSGYVISRVQIDVYAESYVAAHGTAQSIVAAVSGYSGDGIHAVFIDGQRDLSGLEAGDPNELYRVSIDVIVHHAE